MIKEKPIQWTDEMFDSAQTLFDKYLQWVRIGDLRLDQAETQLVKTLFHQLKGREINGGCTGCVVDAFVVVMSLFEFEHRKRSQTIMESMANILKEEPTETNIEQTFTENEQNKKVNNKTNPNAVTQKKPRRIKK
jgi:hypothetical protein